MKEFFHGWQRKAGVVSLGMACVVAGMWVRSGVAYDLLRFPFGGRQHLLFSIQGTIAWFSWDSGTTGQWEWSPNSPDKAMRRIPHMKLLATMATVLDAKKEFPSYRYVHYRWLTIPLTLLSAYLIVWKPRKRACPN